MRFDPELIECRLLRRYKRFLADVAMPDGSELTVHCANPGAMTNCAPPNARAWISDSQNPKRKLRYSLEIVEVEGTFVGVNTQRPNQLVAEALAAKRIPELAGYPKIQPEARYGEASRVDFLLTGEGLLDCYLEVKGVSLGVGEGLSIFPDSVTKRGARHMAELAAMCAAGKRAMVLFCALRADTQRVRPADEIDPDYGRALRAAMAAGVEALAWRCAVDPESGLALAEAIPTAM